MKSKYKITLKEFFANEDRIFIHCDTLSKVEELFIGFNKLRKKWKNGSDYCMEYSCWEYCKENTLYSNKGEYGELNFNKKRNYIIYDFTEVDLEH